MPSQIQDCNVAFIGGGNMAGAIIGGLLAKSMNAEKIIVSEPWDVNRDKMKKLGVRTTESNIEAAHDADLVILAVKPQVAKGACEELSESWARRNTMPLIVSIVAGITLESLERWSAVEGKKPNIVRVMPNTPALVGEGASGVFAGRDVSDSERKLTTALLGTVSQATEWVDKEELLDVVTGLSGSGPAYFFALVEHLAASATSLGLSSEQATRLAAQTCLGAGKMLVESSDGPAQLRINVTSPNGTTQAGLESFQASKFDEIVDKAVRAATDRAEELGKTIGSG